jgi:hypothetical protein
LNGFSPKNYLKSNYQKICAHPLDPPNPHSKKEIIETQMTQIERMFAEELPEIKLSKNLCPSFISAKSAFQKRNHRNADDTD